MRITILAAAVLMCSLRFAFAAPPAPHLLYSFESETDVKDIKVDSAAIERTTRGGAPGTHALQIVFSPPAMYPNAKFVPSTPWDWSHYSGMTMDITNPGFQAITFGVRVDDSSQADGKLHCRQNTFTVDAGKTATTSLSFDIVPATGAVDPTFDTRHIVAFQLFMVQPAAPVTLLVDNIRLAPAERNTLPPPPVLHDHDRLTHFRMQPIPIVTPTALEGLGYKLVKNWDFHMITKLSEFHDEFYTRYNNGGLDTLNDEWEHYRDNDNHELTGSVLSLIARAPYGLKAGTIESGMVRSKWNGEYGYFECRMKVPAGHGMWPAFWLDSEDGIWPPEIDVMEIVNNGRDTTRNSFHFDHLGKAVTSTTTFSKLGAGDTYRPGFDYAEGFHTFAALWTPDSISQYVDNVLVVTRTGAWKHDDGRDGGPAHVLLNLAVGGSWPGAPDSLKDFPASLDVQFIRVWQKQAP